MSTEQRRDQDGSRRGQVKYQKLRSVGWWGKVGKIALELVGSWAFL